MDFTRFNNLAVSPVKGTQEGLAALAQAARATEIIEKFKDDPVALGENLINYVFDHHPHVLDLPPHLNHRYLEAKKVLSGYPDGEKLLRQGFLKHYQDMEQSLKEGFLYIPSISIRAKHSQNGSPADKLMLTDSIRDKILACNKWVQKQINNGKFEEQLAKDPTWTLFKLGEGSWIPLGNTMIEVGQFAGRVRTWYHDRADVDDVFGLYEVPNWLEANYVTTHITDSKLLNYLQEISESSGVSIVDSSHLNLSTYVRSYIEIIELMHKNPGLKIRGVLSNVTWIYNPKLEELFPDQDVAKLHQAAGKIVTLGEAREIGQPIQEVFATQNSARKKAFEEDKFPVEIVSRFIDEEGMISAIRNYGDSKTQERLSKLVR